MKICVFDCETRGLFGEIFRIGFYDGENYMTFNTGIEFIKFLLTLDNIYIYAFNLEFDLSKLLAEIIESEFDDLGIIPFKIDFDSTLVIVGNIYSTKVLDKEIYFKDIYPLVGCSLEKAGETFELQTKKLKTPANMSKDEYFQTVKADDEELNKYLKNDCICTYELIFELMKLSKLSQEDFIKCVSTASLSMRVFKTQYPDDFQKIKDSQLYVYMEDFLRQGYFGGRVEIFKPRIGKGFHYDINSLYPYVMEKYYYPVGNWKQNRKDMTQLEKLEIMDLIHKNCPKGSYMVHAKIHIPDQFYPPLPVKRDMRLIFPLGTVIGHWYRPEFEYALNNCGVEILEIYRIAYCLSGSKVFENFISDMKDMKMNSEGGKKQFAKTIQNALYGKMAMGRLRTSYQNYDEEKKKELESKGHLVGQFRNAVCEVMSYNKTIYADYIAPQFSAIITSYARLELLKAMQDTRVRGDYAYYCDTDSIVCEKEFPKFDVDEKEYGKWKLERRIKKGIFVLPKFYAEIGEDGKEILKSKGIIKQFMENVKYKDYLKFYENLKKGVNLKLYGYNTGKDFWGRRKIVTALKTGKNINERVRLCKQYDFSNMLHKRVYDHINNTSRAIILNEESED